MKYLGTIVVSAIVAYATMFGIYNFLPVTYLTIESTQSLGATITTIASTDKLSDSRAVINTNFANLNSDKIEVSTTTLPVVTTMTGLVTVGALASGSLASGFTPVTVPLGGTGSTTLSSNQVLLGNGTGNIGLVSTLGASGQFLTSGGAGTPPTWTTSAVDQTDDYDFTGSFAVSGNSFFENFNASSTLILNTVSLAFPALQGASSTVFANNGSGTLTSTQLPRLILSTATDVTSAATSDTVVATTTLSGNVLGTNGIIHGVVHFTNIDFNGAASSVQVKVRYGSTVVASSTFQSDSSAEHAGIFEFSIVGAGATNSQNGFAEARHNSDPGTMLGSFATGTAAVDSTVPQSVNVIINWDAASRSITMDSAYFEFIPYVPSSP